MHRQRSGTGQSLHCWAPHMEVQASLGSPGEAIDRYEASRHKSLHSRYAPCKGRGSAKIQQQTNKDMPQKFLPLKRPENTTERFFEERFYLFLSQLVTQVC